MITALNDGIKKMKEKMVVCPATLFDYTLFNTPDFGAHKTRTSAVDKVVDKLCALVCWDNLINWLNSGSF